MPVSWNQESDRLLVCTIRGTLSYKEWEQLNTGDPDNASAAEAERDGQKLRVLIQLENFKGWDQDERWEDLDWVEANDRRLQRLAFVGEESWRERMEIFALKGMRPVEVEYFGPDQEGRARRWLERD